MLIFAKLTANLVSQSLFNFVMSSLNFNILVSVKVILKQLFVFISVQITKLILTNKQQFLKYLIDHCNVKTKAFPFYSYFNVTCKTSEPRLQFLRSLVCHDVAKQKQSFGNTDSAVGLNITRISHS